MSDICQGVHRTVDGRCENCGLVVKCPNCGSRLFESDRGECPECAKTARFELRDRAGNYVGSLEVPLWRLPPGKVMPDGFRIGERVFVWSSKFRQYREPALIDVGTDDPVIRNLFEKKSDPLKPA
jgi:hypothetical protein